ncbi:cytochrome c-551 [Paenibacillus pectinilyticus]|uniref:Cytochrome c-551 n=1 Tax=Paenibacillus pectinilyticus TaxID=512399 RepID=A0A1C1A1V5_9BACL|nr:cytochrome c [Paenibacillus pectinilyticus]OCT14494.1 cytochrome c-551 [Paenibacillus pectinilyticus]
MNTKIVVLTLLLASSLTACSKSNTTPSASPTTSTAPTSSANTGTTTPASADAQTIFKANCVACHGANLEGLVGPSLQKVGGKLSKDQLVATITNGKGAMPSFKGKLSDTDINALATWLADKK